MGRAKGYGPVKDISIKLATQRQGVNRKKMGGDPKRGRERGKSSSKRIRIEGKRERREGERNRDMQPLV